MNKVKDVLVRTKLKLNDQSISKKTRFFVNGILLTAVGITVRTVALLFNAFITRTVGAEGIGLYALVCTVYGFAVTFSTSGISLTVTRLVAAAIGNEEEERVSGILVGAVLYALAFSMLATTVLYFGAGVFAERILGDLRAVISLKILSPSLIPLSLIAVFSGYFIGVRRVACNAVTQIIGQIFKISATVWLCKKAISLDVEASAKMLSIGTTATEIVCFLVVFIEFLIERSGKIKKAGNDLRSVAAVAIPQGISAYIRQALLTLEHILIPRRLKLHGLDNSEALSAYGNLHGMALPVVLYPLVTLSSFSGLLVPEFAEREAAGDSNGMKRICERAFGVTLIYGTLASVLLFVFSEELGFVIYDSFTAGRFIAVLAPIVPIMYLDHVTDAILKGVGEQVYSMWVNITDACLSIALVWLLIPKMGIMGYAVCIIAMEMYNYILSLIRLKKRIHFRVNVTKTLIVAVLSALASAYFVKELFISAGRESTALWLTLEIVFAVSVFVLVERLLLISFDVINDYICKKRNI